MLDEGPLMKDLQPCPPPSLEKAALLPLLQTAAFLKRKTLESGPNPWEQHKAARGFPSARLLEMHKLQ